MCKHNEHSRLASTQASVLQTTSWIAFLKKKPFALKYEGKVYEEIDPVALWDMIMRSTWDWAEPDLLIYRHDQQDE